MLTAKFGTHETVFMFRLFWLAGATLYLTCLTQEGSQAPTPSAGLCHDELCFSLLEILSTAEELGKNAAFIKSAYNDATSWIMS